MTVLSAFLANARTMDTNPANGIDPSDKTLYGYLTKRRNQGVDPAYASGYAAVDQEDSVPTIGGTGGTYTLTLRLKVNEPNEYVEFTTAGIAHSAVAATIEGAIDTAATSAGVPGWSNGDISVAGGPLHTTTTTFTYDGTSVSAKKHGVITIDVSGVTGGSSPSITSTSGQPARWWLQVLEALGYFSISGGPPAYQAASLVHDAIGDPKAPQGYASEWIRREVIKEIIYWETVDAQQQNAWEIYLGVAAGLQERIFPEPVE